MFPFVVGHTIILHHWVHARAYASFHDRRRYGFCYALVYFIVENSGSQGRHVFCLVAPRAALSYDLNHHKVEAEFAHNKKHRETEISASGWGVDAVV